MLNINRHATKGEKNENARITTIFYTSFIPFLVSIQAFLFLSSHFTYLLTPWSIYTKSKSKYSYSIKPLQELLNRQVTYKNSVVSILEVAIFRADRKAVLVR